MKILNLIQGSDEWHKVRATHFTASEAPAMMGDSKYMTRNELLHMKATGEVKAVSEQQQRIFDKGHATEALARVIVEQEIVADDLFPATGTKEVEGLPLLASFDGLTMDNSIIFEHKLTNKELMNAVNNNALPAHYYWQLEQQLLLSGAECAIFVCSNGTKNDWADCEYRSTPERRQKLIDGWKQFAEDLANYVPAEKAETVEAEPIRDLPAITYKMDGLSLSSNLSAYKDAATDLVERSKLPIETDQDFANAESMVKVFKSAEDDIKAISKRVLGEVLDIDTFIKDLEFIGENIRQARLSTDKQVKARKEQIRAEIFSNSTNELTQFQQDVETKINAHLPALNVDIAEAMKGKKTVDSLKDAAATEVAKGKIVINKFKQIALANMLVIADNREYDFLFNDWQQIAFKANDDFIALVKLRISEHKEREEKLKREAEEAARIKAETEAAEARKQALRDEEQQVEESVNERAASERPSDSNMLVENEQAIQANADESSPSHSIISSLPSGNKQVPLDDYQRGYCDALRQYAHWKDGVQYVGTNGKTLNRAVSEFLKDMAA